MDMPFRTPDGVPDKKQPQSSPKATAGAAEKYIRTFAGDMETLKQGGTPDLTPLESHPEPMERLIESSPITPEPAPAPAPEAPLPAPHAYTPPPPGNEPLKTYAGDFSDRMKKTNATDATVLAAEQDYVLPAPIASEPPSRKNLIYIGVSAVLFVAGAVGAYMGYTRYLAATAPVSVVEAVPAPIFVDEREEIWGLGESLMQSIEKSVERPITVGAVRLLYIASTTSSVFASLPISAPDVLLRNIDARNSMAGIIQQSDTGERSPFFILSVLSYSNTFSGLLGWESQMPNDLLRLFPARRAVYSALPAPIATTTATSTPKTSSTTPQIPAPSALPESSAPATFATFIDAAAGSHDVRAYRDDSGRDALVYGYWNQSTLIIARDTASFMEIVARLSTSRTP